MPFQINRLKIADVLLVTPLVFSDNRGSFTELFKESEFLSGELPASFKQVNLSASQHGVLRGLHYQLPPKAQSKLITAISGEIFDVAVDIRRQSPTYGQWVGEKISSLDHKMIFVPAGFAHGFCVLSREAQVVYFCSDEYAPEFERGLIWNDPALAISWPVKKPILSEKDKTYPVLTEAENSFV